jgi:hypothetical protein
MCWQKQGVWKLVVSMHITQLDIKIRLDILRFDGTEPLVCPQFAYNLVLVYSSYVLQQQ